MNDIRITMAEPNFTELVAALQESVEGGWRVLKPDGTLHLTLHTTALDGQASRAVELLIEKPPYGSSGQESCRMYLRTIRNRAKEILVNTGWCQEHFVIMENGEPFPGLWTDFPTEGVSSCCLEGSVIIASREIGLNPSDMMRHFKDVWIKANVPNPEVEMEDDPSGLVGYLANFNDDEDTTLEEVLQSLDNMEEHLR